MSNSLATIRRGDLAASFANKYEVDPGQVVALLVATVLKSKDAVGAAEADAFMVVCNQYNLNPFTKEIFGFMSGGKMLYVISIDGWCSIVNRQPELDGIEFEEHFGKEDEKGVRTIEAITCKIHRKDRALPTAITEYFSECRGTTEPWKKWPIRMLRHKAMIQCSRIAFGLAGIMDEDEASRMDGYDASPTTQRTTIDVAKQEMAPATVQAAPVDGPWKREEARDFHKAWTSAGHAEAAVRDFLEKVCGVDSSLKVPASKKIEAMAWALTVPEKGGSSVSEEEAECRTIMGLLGLNLAEQAGIIDQAGGNWVEVKAELDFIANEREKAQ